MKNGYIGQPPDIAVFFCFPYRKYFTAARNIPIS